MRRTCAHPHRPVRRKKPCQSKSNLPRRSTISAGGIWALRCASSRNGAANGERSPARFRVAKTSSRRPGRDTTAQPRGSLTLFQRASTSGASHSCDSRTYSPISRRMRNWRARRRGSRGLRIGCGAAERHRQELFHVGRRLRGALTHRTRLETERIVACRQKIGALERRMQNLVQAGLERRRATLEARGKLLDSLGYRQVLARGFTLVRDAAGRPLRRAADVSPGARLDIEFVDDHRAVIAAERPRKPEAAQNRPEPQKKNAQGSLF